MGYSVRIGILLASLVAIIIMTVALNKNKKKLKVYKYFTWLNLTLIVHTFSMLMQIIFRNFALPPVFFEYVSYLGASFTPICLLFLALSYVKKEKYIENLKVLYIVPILFLIIIFTNNFHNLFFVEYSINLGEIVYGPMYYLYAVYSCVTFLISIVIMVYGAVKRLGLFSISTLLLIVGIIALILGNVASIMQLSVGTVYLMPILFIVFSICASISVFKYNSLRITPIALKTIMNTMTEAFVVIANDGMIVEYNELFKNSFLEDIDIEEEENLFDILSSSANMKLKKLSVKILEAIIIGESKKIKLDMIDEESTQGRYYEIDINLIKAKSKRAECIGALLLIKDVTEHINDLNELKAKQEIIVKQSQLVSIGEVAGGVAHDINTPISAIKTGIVMLKDLNPGMSEEETEIVDRMDNCANKIIGIVNSMRNQIRNLGSDVNVRFKISDLLEDVKCLTLHEINKYGCRLDITVEDELYVEGDPAKLGQVVTNMVVNAAQSYEGKKGGKINLVITKAPKKKALIKITDFGGGLDESVKPYIFKSILTTKGIAGTGLGLYLAYSVIKGNFNGDITFDSETGVGTTFYITLPLAKNSSKTQDNIKK